MSDNTRTRRSGDRARSNREDVMQLLDSLDTYTPPAPSAAAAAAAVPTTSTSSPRQATRTAATKATPASNASSNPPANATATTNAEDAASVLAFLDEITQRSSTPTARSTASTGAAATGESLSKRSSNPNLSRSTSRNSLQPAAPATSATTANAPTMGAARPSSRLGAQATEARTSATSTRATTPTNLPSKPPAAQPASNDGGAAGGRGGGWGWSSVWNSASSVVAQASSVVQQARTVAEEEVAKRVHSGGAGGAAAGAGASISEAAGNLFKSLGEEQAKWTGKVVGEYAPRLGLDQLGDRLKSTTIKGLKDLLDAVAPPIAEHEVLQVSLSHDMAGYEGVEVLVFRAMSKILEQVEGGTLMVNRGNAPNAESNDSTKDDERNLNTVEGFEQGWKMAEANLDELVKKADEAKASKPAAAAAAQSDLTVPVTNTPLFMRIQPVLADLPGHSAGNGATRSLFFIVVMRDPTNNLSHSTLSQSIPAPWLDIPFEKNEWVEDIMVEVIRRSVETIGQEYINGRMTAQELAISQARAAAQQVIDEQNAQKQPEVSTQPSAATIEHQKAD